MQEGGSTFKAGQPDLRFFPYPSELHLQDGLLCLDETTGTLYSADLMLRYGNGTGKIEQTTWKQTVETIDEERVPAPRLLAALKDVLLTAHPLFVAVGHGTCLLADPA